MSKKLAIDRPVEAFWPKVSDPYLDGAVLVSLDGLGAVWIHLKDFLVGRDGLGRLAHTLENLGLAEVGLDESRFKLNRLVTVLQRHDSVTFIRTFFSSNLKIKRTWSDLF